MMSCVLLVESKWIFVTNKPNIFINLWDTTYCYYARFLPYLIWLFFYLTFLIFYSHIAFLLYLNGHFSPTFALLLQDVLFYNFIPYLLFEFHPIRTDGFPVRFKYGQLYPTFRFLHNILLFEVHLALFLVGSMPCLVYNCMGWSRRNSW